MPTQAASGRERVAADAAQRGIALEFVERTNARSLEEAAQILGITPADIVKSLVVKRHDGSFLFAEIPGDRQISWAKLRAVMRLRVGRTHPLRRTDRGSRTDRESRT